MIPKKLCKPEMPELTHAHTFCRGVLLNYLTINEYVGLPLTKVLVFIGFKLKPLKSHDFVMRLTVFSSISRSHDETDKSHDK